MLTKFSLSNSLILNHIQKLLYIVNNLYIIIIMWHLYRIISMTCSRLFPFHRPSLINKPRFIWRFHN